MRSKLRDQVGFTLLEVLVAMTVLTIGLLGIAAMMITAMQGNQQSRRMTIATNLAQQRIEEMKNIPFENLFQTDPANANNSSNNPPASILTIAPVDNGVNPCTADYPCGDVTANDLIWTYSSNTTVDNKTFGRIWTVERNPNINGIANIQTDEQRTIRVQAIVSWSDATGRWHKVTITSIISG